MKKVKAKTTYTKPIIICVGILVLIVGVFFAGKLIEYSSNPVVATVNGAEITKKEFELFAKKNVASVFTYFNNKYEVANTSEFWNNDYSGESPIDMLEEKTMENVLDYKAKLLLAKESKLISKTSYEHVKKSWKKANNSRENAAKNGTVIFGKTNFDFDTYVSYYVSNLYLDTKDALVKNGGIEITDKEVKDYFENIEEEEELSYLYTTMELDFKYDMSAQEFEISKASALAQAEDAYAQLNNGNDLEAVAKNFPDIELKEEEYDMAKLNTNRIVEKQRFFDSLIFMETGNVSDIVEVDGGFKIFKLVDKQQHLGKEFDDIQTRIKTNLEQKELDSILANFKEGMEVNIIQEKMNKCLGDITSNI